MRLHYLMCAAIILVQSACNGRTEAADASGATVAIPTRVACADLGLLEQRAIGDDLRGRESPTDQARVVLGGRANFFASLAVIARLECVSPSDAEVDRALGAALDVARVAEATRSFYEQAARWSEANLAATQVIAMRVQHLTPAIGLAFAAQHARNPALPSVHEGLDRASLASHKDGAYLFPHGAVPRRTSSVPTPAGTPREAKGGILSELAMQP